MGRGDEKPRVWKSWLFPSEQHQQPQPQPVPPRTAASPQSSHRSSSSSSRHYGQQPRLLDEPPKQRENDDDEQAWNEAVQQLFRHCNNDSDDTTTITTIPHIRQETTWDCGIACLQMVADWLGIIVVVHVASDDSCNSSDTTTNNRHWFLEQAQTESIWTIDLIFILQQLQQRHIATTSSNFSYLFCSRTLSVNEGLQDVRYYAAAFGVDRVRVAHRFQEMAVKQWPALQQSHLSLQHVVDCIQRYNCIAIALVDNHVLCCPTVTDPTTTTTAAASVSNNNPNDTYVGHYVVLAGVSDDPEHMRQAVTLDMTSATAGPPLEPPPYSYCLVVHNPASSEAAAAVSYWTLPHFERSWRAHGTDDDIIFVVKHNDTSVESR